MYLERLVEGMIAEIETETVTDEIVTGIGTGSGKEKEIGLEIGTETTIVIAPGETTTTRQSWTLIVMCRVAADWMAITGKVLETDHVHAAGRRSEVSTSFPRVYQDIHTLHFVTIPIILFQRPFQGSDTISIVVLFALSHNCSEVFHVRRQV